MDKIKGTALFFALFLLGRAAIAYSIGEVITPTQFSRIDIGKHVFDPKPAGNEITGTGTSAIHTASYTIETYKPNSNRTEYEKVKVTREVGYGVKAYVECRAGGTSEAGCKTAVHDTEVNEIAGMVLGEKRNLESEQDIAEAFAAYADEFQSINITITTAEINAAIVAQQQ